MFATLVALACGATEAAVEDPHANGLYKRDSPVTSLTSARLAQLVEGGTPTLVEFYAEWCGHCQQYAKTYEKVAAALRSDVPGLLVAAINCPSHEKDCSSHGVRSYPTIKLFGAVNSSEGAAGAAAPDSGADGSDAPSHEEDEAMKGGGILVKVRRDR